MLDSRGEVDNMGKAQLVVDTSADTAQAEEEETVDLDVVLPDAEDNAVVKDMAGLRGKSRSISRGGNSHISK